MSANEQQQGGSHYKTAGRQHWDICDDYDVPYLESAATKYISRNRLKGSTVLDLSKAKHYIQKAMERETFKTHKLVPEQEINELRVNMGLSQNEYLAIFLILNAENTDWYKRALDLIDVLIIQNDIPPQGTPEDGGHHAGSST